MDETLSRFSGLHRISNTTTQTFEFGAIQAITATTLAAGTVCKNSTGASVTGLVIPAGTTIYGYFSAIQLTSGDCIGYRI